MPEHADQLDAGVSGEQRRALHADVAGGAGDRGADAALPGAWTRSIRLLCITMQSALSQSLDPERPPPGPLDVDRGSDEREMRERLGEVAEQRPGAHVHLLGEEAER